MPYDVTVVIDTGLSSISDPDLLSSGLWFQDMAGRLRRSERIELARLFEAVEAGLRQEMQRRLDGAPVGPAALIFEKMDALTEAELMGVTGHLDQERKRLVAEHPSSAGLFACILVALVEEIVRRAAVA